MLLARVLLLRSSTSEDYEIRCRLAGFIRMTIYNQHHPLGLVATEVGVVGKLAGDTLFVIADLGHSYGSTLLEEGESSD